jgi:nucleoside-diphosphate-sugar epimerase
MRATPAYQHGTMKVLVTGATGYIGSAAADALLKRGHRVLGLARSDRAATALCDHGIEPAIGDFGDPAGLRAAVSGADVDAVVSTASVGASAGDSAATFARDRDAVRAIQSALSRPDQALVFTSGSAVFGTFNDGEATDAVYDEDGFVPLPASTFAPASAAVPSMIASGFAAAMRARVETEQAVLGHPRLRGIVIRPGLVYGRGGSYDVPALIARARARGRAGHLGRGATTQGYVHIDDLAELYCLAVERAPGQAILHGVVDDVTQRQLAQAVNQLLGFDERTENLTLMQMLEMSAIERLGLAVATALPPRLHQTLNARFTPAPSVGFGISLSLNKRLASEKTRRLLGWEPTREDVLAEIASGSYSNGVAGDHGETL